MSAALVMTLAMLGECECAPMESDNEPNIVATVEVVSEFESRYRSGWGASPGRQLVVVESVECGDVAPGQHLSLSGWCHVHRDKYAEYSKHVDRLFGEGLGTKPNLLGPNPSCLPRGSVGRRFIVRLRDEELLDWEAVDAPAEIEPMSAPETRPSQCACVSAFSPPRPDAIAVVDAVGWSHRVRAEGRLTTSVKSTVVHVVSGDLRVGQKLDVRMLIPYDVCGIPNPFTLSDRPRTPSVKCCLPLDSLPRRYLVYLEGTNLIDWYELPSADKPPIEDTTGAEIIDRLGRSPFDIAVITISKPESILGSDGFQIRPTDLCESLRLRGFASREDASNTTEH